MNDRQLVKDYITGADHLQYTQLAEGSVQVDVTHSNLKQYVMELRLDLHTRISEVKRKLFTHNGSSIEHMELHLRSGGRTLAVMLDDNRPLGYYGVQNGMEIHVVDTDPFSLSRAGGLDDVSKIEKYRMSEEDYDSRENTLRAWKRKQQEKDPNFRLVPVKKPAGGEAAGPPVDYTDPACAAGIAVGARCSVTPGDRRGEVKFVGPVEALAPGIWVGIRLDEPLGKNAGVTEKDGKRYFDAEPCYGSFARPDKVAVGDYPPEMDEFEGMGAGAGGEATAPPAQAAVGGCCAGGGGACAAGAACQCAAGGGSACCAVSKAAPEPAVLVPVAAATAPAPAATAASSKGPSARRGGRRDDSDDDNDDEL
jgi:tubulin-folding cofactor B